MKQSITTNDVIRKIDVILEDHKNDIITPLDTDWVSIVKYLEDYILEQQRMIDEYEHALKSWDEWAKNQDSIKENKELDLSLLPHLDFSEGDY